MAQGCVQASNDKLIQLKIRSAGDGGRKNYVDVSPKAIINAYKPDSAYFEPKTLHWLWRLQTTAEVPPEGARFELYRIGNLTMEVTVTTQQDYEPIWHVMCWGLFAIRMCLYIFVECYAMSTVLECNRGPNDVDAAQISFFECHATLKTFVFIALLALLDFATILNPVLNPTAVQQGQFLWAANNDEMKTLLGYTGVKLEMAVLPAGVTVVGRMLTGDNDTGMEIFFYQLAIFTLPILLGRLGYNFALNTSTLCLICNDISVLVRYFTRVTTENEKAAYMLCTDETLATLEKQTVKDKILIPLHMLIGDPIAMGLELAQEPSIIFKIRARVLGISLPPVKKQTWTGGEGTAAAEVASTEEMDPDPEAHEPLPERQLYISANVGAMQATLVTVTLLVGLQLWAITGSTTHPITALEDDGVLRSAVISLAKLSLDLSPTWPFPGDVSVANVARTQGLKNVMTSALTQSDIGAVHTAWSYLNTNIGPDASDCYASLTQEQYGYCEKGHSFKNKTDYYWSMAAWTRKCVPRTLPPGVNGSIIVSNISSGDLNATFRYSPLNRNYPPYHDTQCSYKKSGYRETGFKKVFSNLTDTEVNAWVYAITQMLNDTSTQLLDMTQLLDDIWAMKKGQSWQKEFLPQVMAGGRVCSDGYGLAPVADMYKPGTDITPAKVLFGGTYNWFNGRRRGLVSYLGFPYQIASDDSWLQVCTAWKQAIQAARLSFYKLTLWKGWAREKQTELLLDTLKLATIISAGHVTADFVLRQIIDNGCKDVTTPVGAPSILENYQSSLMTWGKKFEDPTKNVILALALHMICVKGKRDCPTSVVLAASEAISGHNMDTKNAPKYGPGSVAPGLPSEQTLIDAVRQRIEHTITAKLGLGVILKSEQGRTCYTHGCIRARAAPIVKVHYCMNECKRITGTYAGVSAQDVISTFDPLGKTMHWLWRLQPPRTAPSRTPSAEGSIAAGVEAAAGDRRSAAKEKLKGAGGGVGGTATARHIGQLKENGQDDGIVFNLFQSGNHTMLVTVVTKQAYEPVWPMLAWSMFALRFTIFMAFDFVMVNLNVKCDRGPGDKAAGEVTFLECKATWFTFIILAGFSIIDLGGTYYHPLTYSYTLPPIHLRLKPSPAVLLVVSADTVCLTHREPLESNFQPNRRAAR